ncbi:nucleoside triphosphate pyrophosphohydrolase [Pontivivens insulae]|uniref:Nucleoside triphosphate pyrophosphohydrolase n=1 Tax=Pontivivens insulae TaxID=1639689 RepID=A0A2R8AB33_9RHOB|nr:nucleoside triphosphate pyrophosphohydrolase [Pontivivens insulae]RED13335.1 ATP diphosphatase [Pontivivens insulae]SPF29427.1 Nucleoside triphosphate pyrophosphohydrolase [Pontivivens insulae]
MSRPDPDRAASDRLVHDGGATFERLIEIMARLRAPDGCPWDLEQTFATIAPYTVEEAYEVADAIEREDMAELRGELGDLLLQVVYHSQLAAEDGAFTLDDVIRGISDKMVRRHPHVFGDAQDRSAEEQVADWERIKAAERAERGTVKRRTLDDVARTLPALTRALKLQNRAARVGFDWPDVAQVLDKVAEETAELVSARETETKARQAEEYGDLMFVMVNLGRHLGIVPEEALRAANSKFEARFNYIEDQLEIEGKSPSEATLDEMEAHWQAAKSV